MTDARQEFDRIFGDVVMSDNDAAWYIFKAGWNAARASGPYQPEQNDKRPQNCGTGHCSCIECPYTKPERRKRERMKEIED